MIGTFFLATLVAILSFGCGDKPDRAINAKLTKVNLQLNWKPEPQFGGFYAAAAKGIYRKYGLDVTITPGGAGTPTVEMIGAGTVPFAIVSGDEILRARSQGNRVVALFAVYQTNPQGIMTRASRGLKSLDELFAHPGILALERGLPYADFLERKYGFQKLKIVPAPFGDLTLYRTMEDYSMQCFVTSEPLAAKRMGVEPQTFLMAESGYNPYTTVLATSEGFLEANSGIVESMVHAVREGWEAYLNDSSEANKQMGKLNPTMDAQTFAESAEAQRPLIQSADTARFGLGAMTLERWQTLGQQLVELQAIDRPIAPEAIFIQPLRKK